MKICTKCGAFNSDNRSFCIDCGKKLGKKLSPLEEEKANAALNEKLDEMYNKNDPLYVNLFDKIMGYLSLALALGTFIFIIISLFISVNSGILWFSVLFFILASLEALVPEIMWAIEKVRLGMTISDADSVLPSSLYLIMRRVVTVILFIGAVFFFILNFIMY